MPAPKRKTALWRGHSNQIPRNNSGADQDPLARPAAASKTKAGKHEQHHGPGRGLGDTSRQGKGVEMVDALVGVLTDECPADGKFRDASGQADKDVIAVCRNAIEIVSRGVV